MSRPLRPGLVAEGESDCDFLVPVIDRQLRDMLDANAAAEVDLFSTLRSTCVKKHGIERMRAAAAAVADQCHLIFVHADHRERREAEDLAAALKDRYGVPVVLVPKRETESWLLADAETFRRVRGAAVVLLPALSEVERERDPKALLKRVLAPAGVSRPTDYFALMGEDIDLNMLARLPAYAAWVDETMKALKGLRYL